MQPEKKPQNQKLSKKLSMGSVDLNVKDLDKMKEFYTTIIQLDIIEETSTKVSLGKNKKVLLTLHHEKNLEHSHPTHAGLYHFAIVFSSRGDLARSIYHILKEAPQYFSGSGDHLVSEAFYFYDPEKNGIELYYDRDRSQWSWENNQIKMATLYIDPSEYIQRYLLLEEPRTEVQMGHVHLKVGDTKIAKDFYVNILGFDVTAELPGALFISVGGYHHHIGMNSWESAGAKERALSLGLKNFEIVLSDQGSLDSLKERLKENAVEFTEEKSVVQFHDPWKNKITVTA